MLKTFSYFIIKIYQGRESTLVMILETGKNA